MNILRYIIFGFLLLASQLFFAQENQEIVQEINKLPVDSDNAIYEKFLKAFAKTGLDIKEIEPGILNATNNGHYEMIPLVEKTVLPSQKNVQSLVAYYIKCGVSIGAFCGNSTKAIEYLKKGIDLAENNNLNKELFTSLNGQLNHVWGNIAVNYERLSDYKNAATAYLRAGKEIKRYYPINTKAMNTFLACSSYMMYKYLTDIYKGNDIFGEVFPYLDEYAEVGNLKGLSAVWNYFIDSHNIDGLNFVNFQIIPKEKDQKAIAEFYWSTAEHFQYDELYREAIFYHSQLISLSHANSFNEYLFVDVEGIKRSRFENIAYCFDKLGEIENSVRSILYALMDVMSEFGNNSEEYNFYAWYLDQLMEDSVKGPVLQMVLSEFDK